MAGQGIPNLCDLVSRSSDLNGLFLNLHAHGTREGRGVLVLALALLTRSTPGEVGLMLLALGVGEV